MLYACGSKNHNNIQGVGYKNEKVENIGSKGCGVEDWRGYRTEEIKGCIIEGEGGKWNKSRVRIGECGERGSNGCRI